MSNDFTSQMLQYILEMSQQGQPPPMPDYTGKPSGYTAEMARRMNLGQDWLSVQADSSNAALAGPSAYSPEAFQPTSTYTPVDQPGTRELTSLAQRMDTPLGIIAAGILRGSTASAEIAKLQQMYNEAKADGSLATDPLLSQIPTTQINDLGDTGPDWKGIGDRMNGVESSYMQESQGAGSSALYDPNTGEYLGGGNQQTVLDANGNPVLVDVEQTPSEQAQWYADQGLSPPDQQYMPSDLMDPSWQSQDQYAQQAMQDFYNTSDALNALYAQLQAEAPTGKTQFAQTPPTFGKPGPEVPGGGGDAGGDTGWSGGWHPDIAGNMAQLATTGTGLPPMVNAAITAAQAAPAVADAAKTAGSWWAGAGGTIPELVLDAGNDFWNLLAGNQGPDTSQAAWDAEIQKRLDAAGVSAPPQGQDPTGLISDESWAATNAQRNAPLDWGPEPGVQDENGNTIVPPSGGGVLGGGGGGPTGFQGASIAQIMKPNLLLGLNPMGGQPPQPPQTGGSGAITTPPDNQGYGVNGTPPVTPQNPYGPGSTYASDPPGYGTGGVPGVNAPAPGQPIDNPPGYGTGGYQQPTNALDSPAWQALIAESIQRSAGPPQTGQPGNFDTGGASTIPQQGGGVLGIGDYLHQYVLGGGTQPHAGPPPQPQYNPLPQNPADNSNVMSMMANVLGINSPPQTGQPGSFDSGNAPGGNSPPQTGMSGSFDSGNAPGGAGYGPSSWWQDNMNPASTSTPTTGTTLGGTKKSWWQENMVPSWWSQIGGDQADQQVRIGSGNKQSAGGKQLNRSPSVSTSVRGNKRGRASTPATRQGWNDFWDSSRRAGTAANQAYGADYGRAAAVAYMLQQRGMTPAGTQLAARRASATQLGM